MRYLLLAILCASALFTNARKPAPEACNKNGISLYSNQTVPVSSAGADTVIFKNQTRPDSIFLNGTGSTPGQSYQWEFISGPTTPVVQSPASITSWVTGVMAEGFYQFKLTVNGEVSDTMVAFIRDWQQKGIYPCRVGYDTTSKTGGAKIILEPNFKGTYLKSDGTTGTWNQWNFITNVRGYVQSTKGVTLSGGDTLLMEGADSTVWVELGGFGGSPGCPVYLMPRTKPVRIRGVNAFFRMATRDSNVTQYVVVDGTVLRNAGHPYGFLFDNSRIGYAGNEAFHSGWVANFTLKGFHSVKANAFKIKKDPALPLYSRYDKWIQRNILITDNWIDSSSYEGMYIGSSAPDGGQTAYGWPNRMENVSIINNLVTNSRWDGIQLGNSKGGNVIKHNLVYKAGTLNQPSQRAGILLGGNATGVIDSNLVINSKGDGIQVFGYGAVRVYNNIIDSINGGSGDQSGMYQSFIAFVSESASQPLSIYNEGNLVGRAERKMIWVANNNGRMLPGRTQGNTFIHPTATDPASLIVNNVNGDVLENNTIIHSFPYTFNSVGIKGTGINISVTQADTTQTFTTPQATLNWLFGRLKTVSPANVPPVPYAGADVTITLPLDSVLFTGSATDADGGSIVRYQWTQLSGPSTGLILTPDKPQTLVKNLAAGTYNFELLITDNGQLSAKDTVVITVRSGNMLPAVNAGSDQTITLPASTVTLQGSATDSDGTIASYSWTQVSGPAQASITAPGAATTTVTGLVAGKYIFRLAITDNNSGSASDDVTITVNSAPPSVTTKTINVNIYGGSNAYANNAWNNWKISTSSVTNVTSAAFKYSSGTTSAIKATLSHSSGILDNGASYGGGMAPAQVLRYTSSYSGTRTLTLKGLSTSKKYNLELYASRNPSSSSTIFTISGVSRTIAVYNNLTNKATFTDLRPNSSGQIAISISKSGGHDYLNGFAITELTGTTTAIKVAATLQEVAPQKPVPATALGLYPNPAKNNITLRLNTKHTGVMTVYIVAASGHVVERMQLTKQQTVSEYMLPVSGLPAGMYLIRIKIKDWSASEKFIRQ